MIGTPTVNNPSSFLYGTLVTLCIVGFAFYDLMKRKVPDRALLCFLPVVLLSPFIRVGFPLDFHLLPSAGSSISGAAAGFGILLSAALASENGAGIGGGDIKLAACMGFIYGIAQIVFILLTASFLAVIAAILVRWIRNAKDLSLPFVPFLALGALAVFIASLYK